MVARKPIIKTVDIQTAMTKKWSAPEWAILWEVANSTGTNAKRRADAVMMSLWPSRGLELHGVEIKISRSDWKREAADPTKAEEIARFCDRWWVHTPKGLIEDISEIPPAWGLREYDGRAWRTVKEAELTEAQPVTRSFLAAMLRRSDEVNKALASHVLEAERAKIYEERSSMQEAFKKRINEEVERRTERLEVAQRKIQEFEDTFGAQGGFFSYTDLKPLADASKTLVDLTKSRGVAKHFCGKLRAAIEAIEEITPDDEKAA